MKEFDIAVVGGGASGLTAAIEAKRKNGDLNVVILERLPRIGKKLLATGNGRCNYTNRSVLPAHYGSADPIFYRIAGNFNAEEYFRTLGVFGAADAEGRVYPLSGTAASVLDGLRLELGRLGAEILCDFPVTKIETERGFTLFSRERRISAKSVILAGGGCSQSALGSDGSVLRIARSLGLRISKLSPALVPLKTSAELLRGLKGIRVGASASLYRESELLKTERGEVQFGENALSGICIFNLSLLCSEGEKMTVALDLLPEQNKSEVFALLRSLRETRSDAPTEDFLTGLFHKRIGIKLLRDCTERVLTESVKSLTEKDLRRLAEEIKRMEFPILGTAGFEKSQVTKGGVISKEINGCLESVKIPRLFLCGELLDLAGMCGGYNLTFAFASGALAGKSCAERLSAENSSVFTKRNGRNGKPPLSPPAPKKNK